MVKSLSDIILERKSIKKYFKKQVSEKDIGEILEAGRWAPSAGNLQNWRFVIIKDQKAKENISIACLNQDWMLEAPVFIAVCSEMRGISSMYPKLYKLFAVQNCALATENMLLKATELGLGTCIVAPFNQEKIREILNMPEETEIYSIITLGYAMEIEPSIRHSLSEIIFFEKWGEKSNEAAGLTFMDIEKKIEEKIKKLKEKLLQTPLSKIRNKKKG